jgi:formylglycine-generating enzyme required for sulfatase activity
MAEVAAPEGQPSYCVDVAEVSVLEYLRFEQRCSLQGCDAGPLAACANRFSDFRDTTDPECAAFARSLDAGPGPGRFLRDGGLPMRCVDFCHAQAYCHDKGRRLCGWIGDAGGGIAMGRFRDGGVTEWENACSAGGTHGDFGKCECNLSEVCPCGDAAGPSCSEQAAGADAQCPAARIGCTPLEPSNLPACVSGPGIANMVGNVWEWENVCTATACVLQGGSYLTAVGSCTARKLVPLTSPTGVDVGFRCCGD